MDTRNSLFENYISTKYLERTDFSLEKLSLEFDTFDRNIAAYIPNRAMNVLEIGFGTGYFLKYLKERGYRNFEGIEVSSEEVEYVRKYVHENVTKTDTIEFLQKHIDFYDAIVMLQVIEHIPKTSVVDLLKSIKNSLKDKGVFICTTPNGNNPFNIAAISSDFTHEYIYNPESLTQVVKLAGFSTHKINPQKEEGITLHGKITNLSSYFVCRLLPYVIGLSRCHISPSKIYSGNIVGICRK